MITQQKKTEIDSGSSRLEQHNPSSVSTPPDHIHPARPPAKLPWETETHLREIRLLTRGHHPKVKLTSQKQRGGRESDARFGRLRILAPNYLR